MKYILLVTIVISLSVLASKSFSVKKAGISKMETPVVYKDGDIIFQTSNSGQSLAIQLATKSIFSHCGIIFQEGNEWFVYEAVQPVKKTSLLRWIHQGDGSHYTLSRLKDQTALTAEKIKK